MNESVTNQLKADGSTADEENIIDIYAIDENSGERTKLISDQDSCKSKKSYTTNETSPTKQSSSANTSSTSTSSSWLGISNKRRCPTCNGY
jgi:hypothetical protein